jgi:hypothetical protein
MAGSRRPNFHLGDLLANLYDVPIVLFSFHLKNTFFPCTTATNNNPIIFIAFLSDFAHFIALELHDPCLFPAPSISEEP